MVKVRTEAWRIWLQVMLFITLPYCLSAKLTKSPSPTPRFLETQCLSRRRDSAGLSLLLLFLGVHFMWIVSLSTVPPFYSWCYIYILSAYICILIYLYKYILIKIYIYILSELHTKHGAQHGTQSHDPEIENWVEIKSQTEPLRHHSWGYFKAIVLTLESASKSTASKSIKSVFKLGLLDSPQEPTSVIGLDVGQSLAFPKSLRWCWCNWPRFWPLWKPGTKCVHIFYWSLSLLSPTPNVSK